MSRALAIIALLFAVTATAEPFDEFDTTVPGSVWCASDDLLVDMLRGIVAEKVGDLPMEIIERMIEDDDCLLIMRALPVVVLGDTNSRIRALVFFGRDSLVLYGVPGSVKLK